jgi:hypothetical protein
MWNIVANSYAQCEAQKEIRWVCALATTRVPAGPCRERNINWIMTSSKCTLCMRSCCTLICTMPGLKRDESQMHKGPPYSQIWAGSSAVAASLAWQQSFFLSFYKYFFETEGQSGQRQWINQKRKRAHTERWDCSEAEHCHGLTTPWAWVSYHMLRYVGVIQFLCQVLQLLSVRFTQQNLCWISKSKMKHHQKLHQNLDFS